MLANLRSAYAVAEPDVVADALDGEVILINLDSGMYFRARGDAAAAWDAVVSGAVLADLAGEAGDSLDRFVTQLLEHGLVVAVEPASAGAATQSPVAGPLPGGPYDLESYSDLQDLLNLDPVHDVDSAAGWPAAGA